MSLAPRRSTRLVHGALAALLLTFVLEQSPHLVHHLFDDDEALGHQPCPFASSADREPGLTAPLANLLFDLERIGPIPALGPEGLTLAPVFPAGARAPPSRL
jgi:hypothetical protein